ncbi:MAG: GNAT family N-acetyltransferase, partial [Vicingaceae bacterium]|nr:GNAT family N-acetyltransferase [Vicingaceae bacterium]
ELFNCINDSGNSKLITSLPFETSFSSSSSWPDLIYLKDTTKEIKHLDLTSIVNKSPSKTLLIDEKVLTEKNLSSIASVGFKPSAMWINMKLPLNAKNSAKNTDLNIKSLEINQHTDIKSWIKIVEKVLFNGATLNPSIFTSEIKSGRFKLILAYKNNIPVGTTMLFYGKQAGIYMVAIEKEYRKMGIAQALMNFAHNLAHKNGYEIVLLHSTKKGKNLYKKMGYIAENKNYLFYLNN